MSLSLLATVAAVLCIGDSNTELGPSYCDLSVHETINIGKSATTSNTWARRTLYDFYTTDVDKSDVRKVGVLLGGNDAAARRDPNEYADNMNVLIDYLMGDGYGDIVLALPSHAADAGFYTPEQLVEVNTLIDAYALELQGIAATRPGVEIGLDWRTIGLVYPEHYNDFVHFNTPGNTLAAEANDPFWNPQPVPSMGSGVLLSLGLWIVGVWGVEK